MKDLKPMSIREQDALKSFRIMVDALSIEDIETIEQALKRNEPMKVNDIEKTYIYQIGGRIKYGKCPKCDSGLHNTTNKNYCGNCGQALDWREEKE